MLSDSEVIEDDQCPITTSVMQDPVKAADGFFYERAAIKEWMSKYPQARSPMTNEELAHRKLVKDAVFAKRLKSYIRRHPDCLDF